MPIPYDKYPTIDELSYLKDCVGNIQEQLDSKQNIGGGGGGITTGDLTEAVSNILTISNGTGAVVGTGTSIEVQQANGSQDGFISSADWSSFNGKQDALVSGSNIKTINSNSIVGAGNIAVQDTLISGTNIKTINTNSVLGSGDIAVQSTLVSGTNIKTINTNSLLGSGDLSVQDTLVSGTNIKTINSNSLLGSGNISVQDSLVSGTNIKTINSNTILGSGNLSVQDTLVSGTNIKTINSGSILGSGDLLLQDKLVSGTNIKTINGASLLGSGDISTLGFTLSVQALSSAPTDGQTIYFGQLPKAPVTTANISKVYIPKSGTIKLARIYSYSGTAGTAESWSLYIRLNNLTDTLIQTLTLNTNERTWFNGSLSIAVVAGDYIEIKGIQPTWATNPNTTIYGGYIYIE